MLMFLFYIINIVRDKKKKQYYSFKLMKKTTSIH